MLRSVHHTLNERRCVNASTSTNEAGLFSMPYAESAARPLRISINRGHSRGVRAWQLQLLLLDAHVDFTHGRLARQAQCRTPVAACMPGPGQVALMDLQLIPCGFHHTWLCLYHGCIRYNCAAAVHFVTISWLKKVQGRLVPSPLHSTASPSATFASSLTFQAPRSAPFFSPFAAFPPVVCDPVNPCTEILW